MNKIIVNRIPIIVFLCFFFILAFFTYRHYGISFDERGVYSRGRMFYEKVRGNDPVLQKDAVIADKENGFAFYNNFYAAVLYAINGAEDFEIYHLLNLMFASLAFIAIYELVLLETNNSKYAILGPIFLLFTPRFYGDLPANPKDMPFAVYYILSLMFIFIFLKKEVLAPWLEKAKILILGIIFGLTASQRIIGYSIYLVYLIYKFINFLSNRKEIKFGYLLNCVLEFALIFLVGYLIHIITLPLLGPDPFNNFIRLLNVGKNFPWGGSIILGGIEYTEKNIPRYYIPYLLSITTPLFLLVLSACSLFFLNLRRRLLMLTLTSLTINLSFFVLMKPVVYDGVRHGLFLLPHIVVLALLGFKYLYERRSYAFRLLLICFVLLNIFWIGYKYVLLHPYEIIYFNIFAGKTETLRYRYETDYWGLAGKETAEWFAQTFKKSELTGKKLAVNGNVYAVEVYVKKLHIPLEVVSYEKNKEYDFVSCWDRWNGCSLVKGKLIGTISRDGLVLNSIYQKQ